MTAPRARLVHSIPGRARLRAPEIKGDEAALETLRGALEDTPGVQNVRVAARTGSILLEHDGPLEDVLGEAERRGHLRMDEGQHERYLAQLRRALELSDDRLREISNGRVDLETLAFVSFVAGGVYQVWNRHALPAGVTMLRYAVELVTATAIDQARSAVTRLPEEAAPRA